MSLSRTTRRAALALVALAVLASAAAYAASLNVSSNKLTAFSTSTSLTTTSTSSAATADFLVELVASGTKTAGTAFQLKITARQGGTTQTSYTGSKTLAWTSQASPNNTAAVFPSAVTFASGIATNVPVTLFRAGAAVLITAADGARTGSLGVAVDGALLRFTQTTFKNASVTCSPTSAIDTKDNKSTFTTKVNVTSTDAYGNSVVLPPDQSVNVSLAFTGDAAGHFESVTGTSLTISLPSNPSSPPYTSSGAFSATRKDSGGIVDGSVTATASGYGSVSCRLG